MDELTPDSKSSFYSSFFSSGIYAGGNFEHKIELYTLVCFLSFQLQKRFPDKFKSTLDTFTNYIYKDLDTTNSGFYDHIVGMSIVCDDLLWGSTEIKAPVQFKSALEVKDRIIELMAEWQPF